MLEQWMSLITKSLSLEFDEVSSMESNCVPTFCEGGKLVKCDNILLNNKHEWSK